MVADETALVIGVDTHAETHTLALVEAGTQRTTGCLTIPASRSGYRQALQHAHGHGLGPRVWALEGSGSYGAGLARYLADRGETVVEIARPRRDGRQGRLKSDPLDAERAARTLLADGGGQPRLGRETRALQALLATRQGAVHARTQALNELRALLVTAPAPLRERLHGLSRAALLDACARLRPGNADPERTAVALALRSLARRIHSLETEARRLEQELNQRIPTLAPELLAQPGIGPISAATLLTAWSHPGRVRSEAAFARLAGAAPIPASTGKTIRYRLDPGGDRQLNRALHTIILNRRRTDPRTQAYITRRVAEGKTEREAVRCLKRYLARSLYRHLEATTTTT